MEPNTLKKEIYDILSDLLKVDIEKITDDSLLIDEYNLDSIRLLSLIMILETKFNIQFDDEEISIEAFKTPIAVCDFVQNMLDGKVSLIQ